MSWGVLDLITVLPKSDIKTIDSKGVLFVAMLIESGEGAAPIEVEDGDPIPVQEWFSSAEGKEMMTGFWKYFSKQWLKKKGMIDLLNRSSDSEEDFQLHGRTNCALECMNRKLNEWYPKAHPSLLSFAKGLEDHMDEEVSRYTEYMDKNHKRKHAAINFPQIPDEYDDWSPGMVNVSLDEDVAAARLRSVKKRKCKSSLLKSRKRSR